MGCTLLRTSVFPEKLTSAEPMPCDLASAKMTAGSAVKRDALPVPCRKQLINPKRSVADMPSTSVDEVYDSDND